MCTGKPTIACWTAVAGLVALALSSGGAQSEVSGNVLTLEQALAQAAERNPAVAAANLGREVAAARVKQARAWDNPTLGLEVENVLGRGVYADFGSAETTVALSQPLPVGGGRAARIRGARTGTVIAEVDAELAVRALRRDLAIAYAEAIAAARLAEIGRERARIGAETQAAVDRRFTAGLESELQRSRAVVETSGMQAAARRAAAVSLSRRRALAAFWREDTVGATLDQAWFDAAPAARGRGTGPVGDPGGDPAFAGHPSVERAQRLVEQAEARLAAERGSRFGGLEATLAARRFRDQPADSDRAWVLGLSMPLPLWDRNDASIAEARAELLSAEIEAERVTRGLAAEREEVVAELGAVRLEVDALASSGLPSARAAAALARQGYEAGRLSLFERLQAESALTELQERLVRARLQLRTAEARLDSLR
jgi:cobalt-zinc-cadmium efflux system outer membrane protein